MAVTTHVYKRGNNSMGVYRHSDGTIKLYKKGSVGEWQQLGSDIEGESSNDSFGISVAMSSNGNRIAIAGYNHNNGTGHVKVYDLSGSAWSQVGSDIDGEDNSDKYGTSLAISSDGSRIAIGAPNNDGGGSYSGHVRVFDWNGSAWTQVGSDIDGEDAGDKSGGSLAMSSDGSRIAIGSEFNDNTATNAGCVRVYDYSDSSWSQVGSDIDGEASGDKFGDKIAMSSNGSRIVVSSELNDGGGSNAGHARVFDWNGSAWSQVGSDIDGASANDRVKSVAISSDGSRIVVGSWQATGTGDVAYSDAGHIRAFDWNGSAWSQVGATIEGVAGNEYVGYSLAMSSDGGRIVTGAIGHSSEKGCVRVYDYISSAWTKIGSDIVGEFPNDIFGASIATSSDGTRIVAGSPDAPTSSSGHARVFKEI